MTEDLRVTPMGLHFAGRVFPCVIGRGGITTGKREGDGATPAGSHRITGGYYRPDRLAGHALPRWLIPIGPRDLWSDDPQDADYNRHVRSPHRFSHEALRRADPMYDLVLVTDWNREPPLPGRGSAIFIHSWRRICAPTAGCVALARADLLWIVARLTPRARLRVPGG